VAAAVQAWRARKARAAAAPSGKSSAWRLVGRQEAQGRLGSGR